MVKINLHNIISIEVKNSPSYIKKFLKEEFFYFIKMKKKKNNIDIDFKDKVLVPKNSIKLKEDFFYNSKLKTFYFSKDGRALSYDLSLYFKNKISIKIEKDFNIWFFLYIIENSLYLLLSRKKVCMLHAGAVKKNNYSYIIFGPQGSGKTLYTLNKIKEGYSFLGDEYIFLNKYGECLSFPRAVNFKKFHNSHYKLASNYKWNSLKMIEKFKWFFKQLIKTIILRPDWKPMVRLRINRIFPETKIVHKTKITNIIFNFKNNRKIKESIITSRYPKMILKNIQFEMVNRFISIYKCIFIPKDVFLKKIIADTRKLEKNKIEIIKSFIYKSHKEK